MKKPFVSGFTIVRNAIKYDYPVLESIRSILPVVDEMIVSVGNSEDGTRKLIESIGSEKIRIVDSVWDDTLREGGRVLAVETDKARQYVSPKADWCFYIQADEVVHEEDHARILSACSQYLNEPQVDGLLFAYRHFYGSYQYVGVSRMWYRNEIRIIRNHPDIHSYRDAQGFRKADQKLRVAAIPAYIHHYGWVKDPRSQQEKQRSFHKMWHDDDWVRTHVAEADTYDYSVITSLKLFEGTHPEVMKLRIARMNWNFTFDPSKRRMSIKERVLNWIEEQTGKRLFEYKNYLVFR